MIGVKGIQLVLFFDRTRSFTGTTHSRLNSEPWQDPDLQCEPDGQDAKHDQGISHFCSSYAIVFLISFHDILFDFIPVIANSIGIRSIICKFDWFLRL